MTERKTSIIKYLAPFTILVIVAIFIYNVSTHGRIAHPGQVTYKNKCADCHGNEGEGIKTLVPPLLLSDFALENFDSIPCWIKNGMNHTIVVNGIEYDQPMYPIEMKDVEIANVMNYIAHEMLKSDIEINSQAVREKLKNCE